MNCSRANCSQVDDRLETALYSDFQVRLQRQCHICAGFFISFFSEARFFLSPMAEQPD